MRLGEPRERFGVLLCLVFVVSDGQLGMEHREELTGLTVRLGFVDSLGLYYEIAWQEPSGEELRLRVEAQQRRSAAS